MAEVSTKDRERLRKLFALLGSNNASERETAHTKIDDILRKYKRSWNDLLELVQPTPPGAPDPDPGPAPNRNDKPSSAINALTLVHYILEEYVDLQSPHEYVAVALWIIHAHRFKLFMITPRLALLSPVRGCGKTTLLDVIERLLPPSSRADNITPAAIWWLVDQEGSALLIDEADNLDLRTNGPLRAVLNSGHRKGGHISHSYTDHVSILKFIERNWDLKPLTGRSRDNLPNPHSDEDSPYVPKNSPAIGDLFDLFDFGGDHDRD
jgi:hypothetical protein